MSDYNEIDREFAEVEASFFKEARIPSVGNIKRDTCKEDKNGKKPRNPENCHVWSKSDVNKAFKGWKKDVGSTPGGKRWLAYEGAKVDGKRINKQRVMKNLDDLGEDSKELSKGVGTNPKDWVGNAFGKGTTSKKRKKEKQEKNNKRKEMGKSTRRRNVTKNKKDNLRRRRTHLENKFRKTDEELGKTASDHLLYSQNSRFAGHEDDHRGSYMSAQNISEMAFFIKTLFEQVQSGRELPDWVEDKISHAHSDLEDLHSYFAFGRGFESEYVDWDDDEDEWEDEEGFEMISKVAHRGSWETSLYSVDGNTPETGLQILRDNDNDPEIEEILIEIFETGIPYEGFNMAPISLIKKASIDFYMSPSDRSRSRGEKPLKPWAKKNEIAARIDFLKKQRRLSREEEQELSELKKVDLGKKASIDFYMSPSDRSRSRGEKPLKPWAKKNEIAARIDFLKKQRRLSREEEQELSELKKVDLGKKASFEGDFEEDFDF